MATSAAPIKSNRLKEQPGKFRILVGIHLGPGIPGCECDSCTRTGGKEHVYEAYDAAVQRCRVAKIPIQSREEYSNDLIDSPRTDLEARFNAGPNSRKFERVIPGVNGPAAQMAPPEPYPLDKMTFAQLLAWCEEEEIDLKPYEQASKGKQGKESLLAYLKSIVKE